MASLLYPDDEQAPLSLLQPPDDRPPVLQPDPRADALGTVYQQVMDAMEAQRRISAERGLWDDNTGLPTKAGLLDAIGQAGTAVALGTSAPGDAPPPGFTAYHASPHLFPPTPRNPLGEFDPSKIGTGEGAQVYGVGAGYLADKEGVARGYRDALTADKITIDGRPASDIAAEKYRLGINETPTDVQNIADWISSYGPFARNMIEKRAPELLKPYDEMRASGQIQQSKGHMYEVRVNADPAHFLDWDKPLSEQHPVVQKALEKTDWYPYAKDQLERQSMDNPTGRDLHRWLMDDFDPHEGSAMLRDAGIPGIRYLDQGSRDAGEGSRNSVVFSPEIMEIIRRYGLAGLMAGGGAAAMGGQQRQQQ